ncbi:hypothetical protein [Aliterella atlantica]|uniref:Uncharacterized protein n=1 Tax=Aliterella atlantica CENA595 TaxID=1618023 RepID=A0A0D8ZQA5_9CYAN|nr:hypothetical protein [Aliterella atlantica]KJH69381.1 hypothetical protein UH38_24235 [Aliterella atlantica CENA595]
MFSSCWLLKSPSLRLSFLLLLPLLLIAFGLCGEQLTNQVLSRSYIALDKLQAENPHPQGRLNIAGVVNQLDIEQEPEITQVEVYTANSVVKKLEFELAIAQVSTAKAILAQKLGLSAQEMQVGTQLNKQLEFNVQGILAEIEKERGYTKVEIKTTNSALKNVELTLPTTELSAVETAIAQELGLSRQEAKMLVSYRIKN